LKSGKEHVSRNDATTQRDRNIEFGSGDAEKGKRWIFEFGRWKKIMSHATALRREEIDLIFFSLRRCVRQKEIVFVYFLIKRGVE